MLFFRPHCVRNGTCYHLQDMLVQEGNGDRGGRRYTHLMAEDECHRSFSLKTAFGHILFLFWPFSLSQFYLYNLKDNKLNVKRYGKTYCFTEVMSHFSWFKKLFHIRTKFVYLTSFNVVVTFEFVREILTCNHSNQSYQQYRRFERQPLARGIRSDEKKG